MRSSRPAFPVLFASFAVAALAQTQQDPPGFVVQPGKGMLPEETAKAMQLPGGFSSKVFAGEPDVFQPIAFSIDDRGRLWVVENYSYPDWKAEGKDRIVIFEDKDGDGKFDEKKVFFDKLNMGSAIEVGFGGVWVGSCPNLLFIADKDGDDVPDAAPEIVLDGWEHQDMHEILNSFNWGPDGWLYGTQGVFTFSKVGKPGAPDNQRIPLNACVWRLHPQTRKFEIFAHGTSNPWGVDWNDFGQCFITACVIPHLYHISQGGLYQRQSGKHFNENAYDDIKTIALHRHWGGGNWAEGSRKGDNSTDAAGGGHAHAGALVYLGESWPKEYRGTLLMNNIHGNRINNDSLTQVGSGWAGDRRPDFMKSQDKWYRGLALRQGPDGSVYASDWYDARACHQQRPHDRTNGRIYKIVYGETKQSPIDVAKLSDDELVKLQTSKNEWLVRHARRVLQERGPKPEVQRQLAALLKDKQLDVPQRLRVLWALHATKGLDEQTALSLLDGEEAWLRAWTIQLVCESEAPKGRVFDKLGFLARKDTSPVVRLYLASACQRLSLEQRFDIVKALLG
ncbi:MAG TPA: PVC-type heme-binding CxxCH protein, partial [Chthoniobacteraceae bacterium]|nr:PVC-type heme-binding CxxCH protein [Chthoniobacteraceae bacterium]